MATKRPLTVDAGRIKELSSSDELGVSLGQLNDVAVTSPVSGEVLQWNGTGWVNTAGTFNPTDVTAVYAFVTNAESVTITKGQVVYLYAATGNRPSVKLASNTSDATSAKTFGLVYADITAGGTGYVITQGTLVGVDTQAYSEGDTLYLGSTAGSLTATKPYAPNHMVFVGIVERANQGQGEIYVKPQNGYELEELHNVQITGTTADNSLLQWDTATSLWKDEAPSDVITTLLPSQSGAASKYLQTNGSGALSWASPQTPRISSVSTTSGTLSISVTDIDIVRLTLNHSITSLTLSGAVDGQRIILEIIQGTGGNFTIAWPSSVRFGTDITSVTLSTTATKKDRLGLIFDNPASKYDVVAYVKGF